MVVVVKVERVLEGDRACKALSNNGFVGAIVPADGFIVASEGGVPFFVRDTDLEVAASVRIKKKRPIAVTAQSWEEVDGNVE